MELALVILASVIWICYLVRLGRRIKIKKPVTVSAMLTELYWGLVACYWLVRYTTK